MLPNKKVTILGICGGSGSGKTTLARHIQEFLGTTVHVLSQDSYYYDHRDKFDKDGGAVNFDHPSTIDFPLMAQQLQELAQGKTVEVPCYDFTVHGRMDRTDRFEPSPVIILDGTLILSQEIIRPHLHYSIFLDVTGPTRLARRMKRDIAERGRTAEGVLVQFEKQVRPMHDLFVNPSREFANCVLTEETDTRAFAKLFCQNHLYSK